ncbi:hypothetical protein QBC39DRAFT_385362 [Podospora conica]|nr:hypothetical protein QBC39DRAFT_385362 [Schizothecium conicum]
MSAIRIAAMRTALRPTTRRVQASAQRRLQSTHNTTPGTERGGRPTGSPVGNKGTTKEAYKTDGSGSIGSGSIGSNKNLAIVGAAALALGGMYSMFMARPEKVAEVGYKTDPDAVAKHRAQG